MMNFGNFLAQNGAVLLSVALLIVGLLTYWYEKKTK